MSRTKDILEEKLEVVPLDNSLIDYNENNDPMEVFRKKKLKEVVNEVLSELDPREQIVLQLRFGLNNKELKKLEEVAKEIGVTRERARQIELKAFDKLHHPTRIRKLRGWK